MAEMITTTFESASNLGPIYVKHYPANNPRGVVQILTGMLEHAGRYESFAQALNRLGFAAIVHDYAGQGRSTPGSPRGFFGNRGGCLHLIEDIRTLQKTTAAQYPNVPYFLLGHSMGSFLGRLFCAQYGADIDGAIFIGTSGMGGLMPAVGKCVLFPFPKKRPLMFFRAMSFAGYNKTYPKPHDSFSWLSRDEAVVKSAHTDPLRIATFTARGFHDLLHMIGEMGKRSWYASMPKNLPILLLAGADDPVSQYGKGAKIVADRLKEAGVLDVSVKLYPNARHEVLNELNKDEAMDDIAAWLNRHAKALEKGSAQQGIIA